MMLRVVLIVYISILYLAHAETIVGSVHVQEELKPGTIIESLKLLYTNALIRHPELSIDEKDIRRFNFLETSPYYTIEKTENDFLLKTEARLDRESLCEKERICCPSFQPMAPDKCKQSLLLIVEIHGQENRFFNLDVLIQDLNDNPPKWDLDQSGYVNIMDVRIPEDAEVGYRIFLPPALDPDAPSENITQTFYIENDQNVEDYFKIHYPYDNQTSNYKPYLLLNKRLDMSLKKWYYLTVIAKDGGNPPLSSELKLNITIYDVNNNQPSFNQTLYEISIPENHKIGRIFRFQADDLDESDRDKLEYYFDKRGSVKEGPFEIESKLGYLVLKQEIDYETKSSYSLQVFVTDGEFYGSTKLLVKVVNVNDNYPVISLSSHLQNSSDEVTGVGITSILPILRIFVPENGPQRQHIATLTYYDQDEEEKSDIIPNCLIRSDLILLEHMKTPTKKHIFTIRLIDPLDRETTPKIRMRVECTDRGSLHSNDHKLTSYLELNINVLDVNDCAPSLGDRLSISIAENLPSDKFIQKINVYDKDEPSSNNFTISLGSIVSIDYEQKSTQPVESAASWLRVDSTTGNLYATNAIDRELVKSFTQEFHIFDGEHNVTEKVRFQVTDVNDCSPRFDKDSYIVEVYENVKAPYLLTKIQVHDLDVTSPNNRVKFKIEGISENDQLINWLRVHDNGEVWIKSPLKYSREVNFYHLPIDREKESVYFYTISAVDKGTPSLENKTSLQINILDVNDNRPEWRNPSTPHSIVNITRDFAVGDKIYELISYDKDTGKNGQVQYKIISGNEREYFSLNKTSGWLTLNKNIPDKKNKRYFIFGSQFKLYIQAIDLGDPQMTSNTIQLDIQIVENADYMSIHGPLIPNPDRGLNNSHVDYETYKKKNHSDYLMLIGLIIVTFIVLILILIMLTVFRCHQQKLIRSNIGTNPHSALITNNHPGNNSFLNSGRWNYDTVKVIDPRELEQFKQYDANSQQTYSYHIIKPKEAMPNYDLVIMGNQKSGSLQSKTIPKDFNNQTVQVINALDKQKDVQPTPMNRKDSMNNRCGDYTPLNFLSNSPFTEDVEMTNSLKRMSRKQFEDFSFLCQEKRSPNYSPNANQSGSFV